MASAGASASTMPNSTHQAAQDGRAANKEHAVADNVTSSTMEDAHGLAASPASMSDDMKASSGGPATGFPFPRREEHDQRSSRDLSSEKDLPGAHRVPKKSMTTPLYTSISTGPDSSPALPGNLQRIGSAPLQATRSKGASQRPLMPRQNTSILQRFQSRRNHHDSAFFDPNLYHDYEESSGDDSDSDSVHEDPKFGEGVRRVNTAPNRQASNKHFKRFAFGNEDYKTRGHVSKHDGRLNISLHETDKKGYLAKMLGASLEHHLKSSRRQQEKHDERAQETIEPRQSRPQPARTDTASTISNLSTSDPLPIPKLNIVIMVIGSRGDIQPFLRLGKILKEEHGHRVRIATHPTFKDFVENDAKLEFFSVGGDPAELMAFMVKNPGLVPKTETITSGEIPRRRAQMFEMFQGFWRACISSTDDELDPSNRRLLEETSREPFIADAIIANPPSFAHIHCAERLGIPLHLMFTFPNTPTQQFPHPLTNIRQTNVDANYTNFMSYPLVEMMQWQGLGDLINDFRVRTLGLDPMSMLWAPGQIYRMKVPYSYLWSPGLIPKPPDWSDEINITGFVFLDLASSFKPPEELSKFLDAGEPPVYIGFGSIVVDDPDKFTSLVFEAVKKAGVRALVSKGWGGLGGEHDCPDNIFLLDNTPHDWLFPRVSAVVHHGGAGTTAIGLKCGKPTMIVPFFGDQPFWGAMVAKADAGAEPVPYKQLDADKLAEGIKLLLTEEKQKGAKALADKIEAEGDGAVNAVKSFHKHLPTRGFPNVRCSILRDRAATWHLKKSEIRLSSLAAQMLIRQNKISWNDLRLVRVYDWNDFESPGEPITGVGSSLLGSLIGVGAGVGKTPFHIAKIIKQQEARDKVRKQMYIEDLRSEIRKEDKKDRKRRDSEAKKAAKAEAARAARDPKHESNSGEAGAEGRLPAGNQPDGLTQSMRQHSTKQRGQSYRDDKVSSINAEDDASDTKLWKQLLHETGSGFRDSGSSLVKLPINFMLALARGCHNAPRLYGDDTVRTTPRITGFHSGCRAAGSELMYGVYDGVTGVFTQPYTGAKYNGVPGFLKGVGKGVGGFFLKDASAILGVPAYTLKGIHKEAIKYRQPTAFIRRSRVAEGVRQYEELTDEERREVAREVAKDWKIIEEVSNEIERIIKEKGMKGRVEVWRNRRWLKEAGIVGNVDGMQRALDAYREGRDWEDEFREEKARHQRSKAAAHQASKDARGSKYARTESGKRMRGPDLRMKTRFGTYRALKKGIKKSEKQARRESVASSVASRNASYQGTSGAPYGRPRGNTHMADEATGTSAIDQAAVNARAKSQGDIPHSSKASSPTMISSVVSDNESLGLPKGIQHSRHDSGDTLVQSHDGDSALKLSALDHGISRPAKIADIPLDATIRPDVRGIFPRTTTA